MPSRRTTIRTLMCGALVIGCRPGPLATAPTPASQPSLVLTEVDEKGVAHQDCRCLRVFADINSLVRITPQVELDSLAGGEETAELERTRGRIRALSDSVREIRQLLGPLIDSLPAVAHRIASSARVLDADPADRSADTALRAGLAAHRNILEPVLEYLGKIDPEGADRALSRPDETYQPVAALLRDHIERLNEELAQTTGEYQREARAEALHVQVWAIHYSARRAPVQVHVEGYDNLTAGDPNPVEKLGFSRTPAEQADLDRSISEHRQLVTAISQLRAQTRGLKNDLDSLRHSVIDAAREIKAVLDSVPAHEVLASLANTVGQQSAQLATKLRDMASAAATVDSLRDLHATLLQGLRIDVDRGMAIEVLVRTVRQSIDRATRLIEFGRRVQRMGAVIPTLDDAVETALRQTRGDLHATVDALKQDSIPKWKAAITSLQNIPRQYDTLKTRLNWFANVLQLASVATTLGGADVSADPARELIAVSADELRPGMLDLTRIGPLEGDQILLTLRVFDAQSGRTVAQPTSTLHVRTYGWHRRWSGGLAFTRESRPDGVLPGVSASWILHYRSKAQVRPDGSQRDGNTLPLDIGFGLTSVVITRNSEVQLGIGPVVSLFGDAIVLGAGYNLQRQRGYALLSTPLLDLVNRISRPSEATPR